MECYRLVIKTILILLSSGFCVYKYTKTVKHQDMKTTNQENRKSGTTMKVGKGLFILLFSLGLAYGASAQRFGGHGGVAFGHGGYYGGGYYPRTYVGVGFGFGYPFGYYPYGWYGPWGYPYAYPPYYYGYGAMPTQLELQIKDIKNDYDQQIKDVRHDKALTHPEKRQKIDQLKADRDNAVVQARHDYFNRSRQYYQQRGNGNQNQPGQQNQNQQNQQNQPAQPKSGSSSNEGPEYQDQGTNTAGSK
jgi:hypothetical protein